MSHHYVRQNAYLPGGAKITQLQIVQTWMVTSTWNVGGNSPLLRRPRHMSQVVCQEVFNGRCEFPGAISSDRRPDSRIVQITQELMDSPTNLHYDIQAL